jgi:hypothetical protein
MQLVMLKDEFEEIYSEQAPQLVKLVLWCLENEYAQRPNFFDLESQMNKIESDLLHEKNQSKLESYQNEQEIFFKRSQLEMKNLMIDDSNKSMNFVFSKTLTSPSNETNSSEKKEQKIETDHFPTFSVNYTEKDMPQFFIENKSQRSNNHLELENSLEEQKNINNILSIVQENNEQSVVDPVRSKADFTKKSMSRKKSVQKIFDQSETVRIKPKERVISVKKMRKKETKLKIFDDSSKDIRYKEIWVLICRVVKKSNKARNIFETPL